MDIVLIHPPLSRPCEPPPGLARLAGALKAHGRQCLVIDANLEGLLGLLDKGVKGQDTFTRRAVAHLEKNLADLRSGDAFRDTGRYAGAVTETSRILEVGARPYDALLSLNNFQHRWRSPVRSADLIASAGEPGENVFFPSFGKRLDAILEEHAPRIMGFSLNFLSQALTTFAMVGHLRARAPGVKIVLGGGLVTSWMKRPGWTNPFSGLVDEMVAGPGEEPLLRLAGIESSGENHDPDYDPFRDHAYLSPGLVLPFSSSSGCYWSRCSFCPERAEGNRYSCIPARTVPARVDSLSARYAPSLVHITDNAMAPSLLAAIAEKGMPAPWYGFARFTSHLTDPDFCRALKRSGCVMLQLGMESGDQGVLDSLDKGIRVEDASRALKNLKDAGIGTYVYLLFGTPAEDEEGARKTQAFITEHAGCVDFLNLSIFNLPRGGDEARGLETYDFFEGDLSLYQGFVHPKGWDRSRVRRFLDRDFRRSSAIATIVRNDPPFFTSNHAPFFLMKGSFFTGIS
jgi:hypothetical protein